MLPTDKIKQAGRVFSSKLSVGESQMLPTDKIERAERIIKSFRQKFVRRSRLDDPHGQNR